MLCVFFGLLASVCRLMFDVVPYFMFLVSCLFVVCCCVCGVWRLVLGFDVWCFGVLVFVVCRLVFVVLVFVACRCLFVVCLCVGCCLGFVVWCLMFVLKCRCLFFVVCCLLIAVCCVVFVVRCVFSMCIVYCS